jgi:predicted nucleic acid-binding protein
VRFVDTSFWVALFFTGDANHEVARQLWSQGPGPLLSSNHVLGETWTFLRRRRGHSQAVSAVEAIQGSPKVTTIRVDEATEHEAWDWLRRHDEREYSFVDATSFAVMRRRRVRQALAFDGDFAAAGFIEVRP